MQNFQQFLWKRVCYECTEMCKVTTMAVIAKENVDFARKGHCREHILKI